MFLPDQYALLEVGHGRKVERFGQYVLDRPAPAAEGIRLAEPRREIEADARFERADAQRGAWEPAAALPAAWTISCRSLVFELRPTDSGAVGVFPEHAEQWAWLERVVAAAGRPLELLNLFAYTGGATLAAARAGARVVHVDAAQSSVLWARRNAELSGLAEAPVRWIADDAQKFVSRELRRGRKYDGVVLDPPSYGHGRRGEAWQLGRDLAGLLSNCAKLTHQDPACLLLSCHTPGYDPDRLAELAEAAFGRRKLPGLEQGLSAIPAAAGGQLDCGAFVRWPPAH